ncbi:helix-turn-helix domain-containing protein [Sporosarcina contaminans]|uniref:Helix-turn-helix domain-containing protein n=1 Tax=Sporosarcina contaminans TaxID=633403 RepID=A0ABW3TTI8_9BACL
MNFGERLKQIRIRRGMTLLEVAEKLGKTEATIQRYESGNIKNPKSDTIQELAEVYNVNPAYLMGWEENQYSNLIAETSYPYITTPISAGDPEVVEAVERLDNLSIPDSVMGRYAGQSGIHLMRVNGESMNRIIPNGSLIAVKKMPIDNIKDGDIVVYRDSYNYAVKRIYRDNNELIFRPDSHDPTFRDYVTNADEQLDIIGKVVVYIVELD